MQRNFLRKEQKLGKACEPAMNRTEEGDNAALLRLLGVIVPCINILVQTQKADCFCNRFFLSPKFRKAANCAQNAGGQKHGCAVPEWTAITEVDTKKKPGRRITRHYAALLRISNGVYPFSFIAITLGSNPCTCVYCLDMKQPSSCSFDFLNSTTGGCFVSLSIFF